MSVAQRSSAGPGVATAPRARRAGRWRHVEGVAALVAPAVLIVVLSWPLLVRPDYFGDDWSTHLWFVWHQTQTLLDDHRPSLFVNYGGGVFYPHFAFYGGTLYTLAGLLSAVLGGVGRSGYIVSWVASFAAGYAGWVWLGRMAGLGRWVAQAPAVLFVTSPYLITTAYVRGDWPEFVAVSSMPLLAAAAISILRADRLRFVPGLALAGSAVLFTGSHNITLLWGGTFFALLAVIACALIPQARSQVSGRGILRLLAILVPALLVNAWFLVPDVAYQAQTEITTRYDDTRSFVQGFMFLVASDHIFSLRRASADTQTANFVLALPVLAMAWIVVAGVASVGRRARNDAWLRLLALLALSTTGFVLVMTHAGLVLALPRPYALIQFTYRIESYILLGVCGAVLAALVLLRGAPRGRRRRHWAWVLAPVLAASVVAGIAQVDRFTVTPALGTFEQPVIASMGMFTDATVPEAPQRALAKLTFPPEQIRDDRVTVTTHLSPGQEVDTNLMVMPALVHVTGAKIVAARTVLPAGGVVARYAVLQVDRDAAPGAAKITVSAAHPFPVTAGQVLSLLGILGLLANFIVLAVRGRRWS